MYDDPRGARAATASVFVLRDFSLPRESRCRAPEHRLGDMGTRGTGRRRSMKKEKTTAEEEALKLVSAQAEAKLAAQRATRAEAREIRLQELERRQRKEEDKDYSDEESGAPLTSPPPLGGTSCPLGDGDTCVGNGSPSSSQRNQAVVPGVEEKYRQAMVSNAQLYNEKNQLMYVVDALKDSLLELEELLAESRREYQDKVKEHEQEKQAHRLLMLQFREMKDALQQHQELLNERRNKPAAPVPDRSDLLEQRDRKEEKTQALAEENRLGLKDAGTEHGVLLTPSLRVDAPAGVESVNAGQESERRPADGTTAETELRRDDDADPPQKHGSALPEEPRLSAGAKTRLSEAACPPAARTGSKPEETTAAEGGEEALSGGKTSQIIQEEPKTNQSQRRTSKPRPHLHEEEGTLQSVPTGSASDPQQNPQNAPPLENGERMEEERKSSSTSGKKKKKKRGKRKGGNHDNKNQQKPGTDPEADATNSPTSQADDKKEPADGSLKTRSPEEEQNQEEAADLKRIGTLHPKKTEPENERATADGPFQLDVLEEPSTEPASADPEDTPVQKEEPGVGTHTEAGCSDQKETSELEPASNNVSESEPLDWIHVSAGESESTRSVQGSAPPPEEEGAEAAARTKPCPPRSPNALCSVVTGFEGGGEAETCPMRVPSDTPEDSELPGPSQEDSELPGPSQEDSELPGPSQEDSELPGPSQEDSELPGPSQELRQPEGGASDADRVELTADVCASSSSDLEAGPNTTGHPMEAGAPPGGVQALAPEVEEKPSASEPNQENGPLRLELESSPSHSCGGGPEEEEGEDEEGRSFDFDDAESELAAVCNPSKDRPWGEVVKVTTQSPSDEEERRSNLSESGGVRGAVGQEQQSSSPSCDPTAETTTNEAAVKHAGMSSELTGPVEARLTDQNLPKLSEQAGGSDEVEGKEGKKSSRKGKNKSKEDCKMS